jgi:hypothetical protein
MGLAHMKRVAATELWTIQAMARLMSAPRQPALPPAGRAFPPLRHGATTRTPAHPASARRAPRPVGSPCAGLRPRAAGCGPRHRRAAVSRPTVPWERTTMGRSRGTPSITRTTANTSSRGALSNSGAVITRAAAPRPATHTTTRGSSHFHWCDITGRSLWPDTSDRSHTWRDHQGACGGVPRGKQARLQIPRTFPGRVL